VFGGIEAGGTKFVCGIGTGPDDLRTIQIPTTTPEATVEKAVAFFRAQGNAALRALGIGSFGPVDLRTGHITSTPKAAWRNFDLAGTLRRALDVPVAFDTDVNAAALGEARWGAARDCADFIYVTVGTGIGGGAVVNGRVAHGLAHPEMGHMRIPRDPARDPFPGCCPYHGDCLEGLACGPAVESRWGCPPEALSPDHPAWPLEAHYLALALNNLVCVLSPQRIVIGGGVMQQPRLLELIRADLAALLNGYTQAAELVQPQLGARAGVLGALVLAEQAAIPVVC
jgi:fructokinase